MRVVILQDFIPHYREEFFNKIKTLLHADVYCLSNYDYAEKGFKTSLVRNQLARVKIFNIIIFNPLLLLREYDIIITPPNKSWFSLYILIILKKILFKRTKIIFWGHGRNVKKYLINFSLTEYLKLKYYSLVDAFFCYTENEKEFLQKHIKYVFSLNNTINVERILSKNKISAVSIKNIKKEHSINYNDKVIIYIARFIKERRLDLLVELIQLMKNDSCVFIIVGGGTHQYNFRDYDNVRFIGPVYDEEEKSNLFAISDICFQPAWAGLSLVESMAYGVPFFTFKRSKSIHHSVEYGYVKSGYNGYIADNLQGMRKKIKMVSVNELKKMGNNSKTFVNNSLQMKAMVDNFVSGVRHTYLKQ